MKKLLFFLFLILLNCTCYSQKLQLTDTSYTHWSEILRGHTKVSPDGRFLYYRINNKPLGGTTSVIAATDKSWQVESANLSRYDFTADSKALYLKVGDSLIHIDLKTKVRFR